MSVEDDMRESTHFGNIYSLHVDGILRKVPELWYTYTRWAPAHELAGLGKHAVEPLILRLKWGDNWYKYSAMVALGEIGDLRSAEAVIDFLFTPQSMSDNPEIGVEYGRPDITADQMRNLFGDYTTLILASTYLDTGFIGDRYSCIQKGNKAVQELCKIHTQISSNVLHKISYKKNVAVPTYEYAWNNLDFMYQRKIAKEELERRGSPAYVPSTYLNKEAWKLSNS